MKIKFNLKKKFKKFWQFLKEIKLELKRVNWLNKREAFKYTLIVIISSVVLAIILGGMDYLLTLFLNKLVL